MTTTIAAHTPDLMGDLRRAQQLAQANLRSAELRGGKAAYLHSLNEHTPRPAAERAKALLLNPATEWARLVTVFQLLRAIPKLGPTKAKQRARAAGVDPTLKITDLTERERAALAAQLADFAATVKDAFHHMRNHQDAQHMADIAQIARTRRLAHADLLCEIRRCRPHEAGVHAAANLLRRGIADEHADLPLMSLLTAIHQVGECVARAVLHYYDIPTTATLRALSPSRRQQLADVLDGERDGGLARFMGISLGRTRRVAKDIPATRGDLRMLALDADGPEISVTSRGSVLLID